MCGAASARSVAEPIAYANRHERTDTDSYADHADANAHNHTHDTDAHADNPRPDINDAQQVTFTDYYLPGHV